eukprot:CAMPEP_0174879918 /NCGR_PEP_ID=MMETSP1114-20130205/83502_1 /TAXON_ID=312471 /ORGANISM="Neobodo designis, Strain CCAP 1951/1" /LENGTH=349 /DNA_ID=CAMNT_0016115313 /DNA_START=61 /DNA_END=1111 /DNA_ORIENTATION=-
MAVARRFAVKPVATPDWVRRTHVAALVRRCWCVMPHGYEGVAAAPGATAESSIELATLLHGTSFAGMRNVLLEGPELCFEAAQQAPAGAKCHRIQSPEAPLFASRTERRDDVRVAETYASVAHLAPMDDSEASVLAEIIRSLDATSELPDKPAAQAEGRRHVRALPIVQFEADLRGASAASDGPMVTADGRVMFEEHDTMGFGCKDVAETYASVAHLAPMDDSEASVLAEIIRSLDATSELPDKPAAQAEGRRHVRALPIVQFEADLRGASAASDGPMVTADGRVVFEEHDTMGFGCKERVQKESSMQQLPMDAPITYFVDTGMAFAVPWSRIRAGTLRGMLLELAASD